MVEPSLPIYDGRTRARQLLRTMRPATLATLQPGDGFPLATLTTIATDYDGAPILLLSQLSNHTRNLDVDCRCSLLLAERGKGDPLTHPRLSLIGRARKVVDAAQRRILRRRFLARNPKAGLYADFGDFSFWRVDLLEAHMNGGFGKAADFNGLGLLSLVPEGWAQAEQGWLERLNATAQPALRAAAVDAGGPDLAWSATGLDAGGLDLAAGEHLWRLDFKSECESVEQIGFQLKRFAI